jgi:hypothetical protein
MEKNTTIATVDEFMQLKPEQELVTKNGTWKVMGWPTKVRAAEVAITRPGSDTSEIVSYDENRRCVIDASGNEIVELTYKLAHHSV